MLNALCVINKWDIYGSKAMEMVMPHNFIASLLALLPTIVNVVSVFSGLQLLLKVLLEENLIPKKIVLQNLFPWNIKLNLSYIMAG